MQTIAEDFWSEINVLMNNAATLEEAGQLRDKYRQMSRCSFRDTSLLNGFQDFCTYY